MAAIMNKEVNMSYDEAMRLLQIVMRENFELKGKQRIVRAQPG